MRGRQSAQGTLRRELLGLPTKPSVARAFSELIGSNVPSHFSGSIQNHVDSQLAADPDLIRRFLDLEF